MNSKSFRLAAEVMLILMPAIAEGAGFDFVPGTIVRPTEE